METIKILDTDKLPTFIEGFVDTAAKTLDEFDLSKNDGWLGSIPFGKIAGFAVKKIIEKKSVEGALMHAIGFACGFSLYEAFHRYKLQPTAKKERYETFIEALKEKRKDKEVQLPAFDLHNFWHSTPVQEYTILFENFLRETNLTENDCRRVLRYMQDYTKVHFVRLLEEKETVYQKLNTHLKSKSYEELVKLHKKERYETELKNLFTEVTLNDERGLTLDHLYIEPYFKIYRPCLNKIELPEGDNHSFIASRTLDYQGSLHDYIPAYLNGRKPMGKEKTTAQVVFIYGYPGQGKTSFCKKLLYDLFHQHPIDKPVYFIKFRSLRNETTEKLLKNPLEALHQHLVEEDDLPLEKNALRNALLILDGLDELLMKNNLNNNDIERICKELLREAEHYPDLTIVITSRYGYIDLKSLPENEMLVLQLQVFDEAQQLQWLEKYRLFYPEKPLTAEKIKEINQDKNYLKELINQPILLFLVASLDNLLNEPDANRARVYELLFDELTERSWDRSRQIDALKGLRPEDLRAYLRELAFEIFKSGDGYIHKSKIDQLEATKRFKDKLQGATFQSALKTLMIAFYFQEVKRHEQDHYRADKDEFAIEFLHKSLQEYLCAEKMYYTIKEEFLDQRRNGEYYINTGAAALQKIEEIFGDQRLAREMVDYLIEIIENDEETDKSKLAERLSGFLEYFLLKDFLYAYYPDTHINPIDRAMNNFNGYWKILSTLQPKRNYFNIHESYRIRFFYLVMVESYNYWNLSYQNLDNLNFPFAFLGAINFKGASVKRSTFSWAYMSGMDLSDADFSEANLNETELERANLEGTNLESANLQNANLQNANLENANLQSANLQSANLQRVNFKDARGLTKEQLLESTSLFECKGLPEKWISWLQEQKPSLFENPQIRIRPTREGELYDEIPF